jgi:DNA polymerase
VLVLGQEALATLGHDGQSLDELRGRAHWLSVDKTTVPVIVSFAPQALLREPLNKAGAWRDLLLAKSAQTQS